MHHAIYFVLLFVLAGSQSVSNFMMSGMEILLAVNWMLEMDFKSKWQRAKSSPLLLFFLVLMAVHLVWMIPSENVAYGWNDLFKKLPLLAIPLVVLTSSPLNRKQLQMICFALVGTVFVATIVGRVRMYLMPDLPYRQVPFISHIRFSLNICLSIILVFCFICERYKRVHSVKDWLLWLMVAVMAFVVDFLFKIRSFTAFAILFAVATLVLVFYRKRIVKKSLRLTATLLLVGTVLVSLIVSLVMVRQYYRPCPLMTQPLASTTANGNPYQHKQDGLIECGNYVHNYVCVEELEWEWAKRSDMLLTDTTEIGYPLNPALVRYLNAMGTTKDSVGMQLLNDEDVAAIEKGIANPYYIHGNSLQKMFFVMLYEYESYRCFQAVKDFTMLQRFELWRNAWTVFCQHPVFGVGTGDVTDACHKQLAIDHSALEGTTKHAHNQYLTFLVTFGIVGFLVIAAFFVKAIRRQRLLQSPVMAAYIIIVLVSFITEDTLETLAGCLFSVLFFCLFATSVSDFKSKVQ